MIRTEYNYIVSLGSFCQTAYQIRRIFNNDSAFMFDWWVTPTVGLIEAIEAQFKDLFLDMAIVDEPDGPAVMCQRYGIMHYHDFDHAKVNGSISPFLVRLCCLKNLEKFCYLLKKLLLMEGRVLFVRVGDGYVRNYEKNSNLDFDLTLRLMNALRSLLPNADVSLLLINGYSPSGIDNVYSESVVDDGETGWQGSNKGWDDLFDKLNIRLVK